MCNTTATAGTIRISAGTLSQVNRDNVPNNLANVAVTLDNVPGATLALNGRAMEIGSLAGGGVTGGGVSLGGNNLTVGALNTDTEYSGAISGTGALAKAGGGTLALTGTNTYTGATTVAAGVLVLSGSGSISNSSPIDVAGGATLNVSGVTDGPWTLGATQTLKGNGLVSGNLMAANGHIAPGNSIGTLNMVGDLTINGTLDIEYNGSQIDLLEVTGNLDISSATVNFAAIAPFSGTPLIFATYYGGTLTGEFANVTGTLPNGWDIEYAYDDGLTTTNIALIPEPTVALLALPSLLVFFRRRR